MPLADDVTTGKGPRQKLLDELRAAAPSRSTAASTVASSASAAPEAPYRPTLDKTLSGPQAADNMLNEIAMRAGALTTVEGVEDDQPWRDYSYGPSVNKPEPAVRYGGVRSPGQAEQQREDQAVEQAAMDAQAKRTTDKALGTGQRGRSKVLSLKEYKDLSPDQKAATDFNTLLSKAVASDRKLDGAKASEGYDSAEAAVFGKDQGDTYAPATVALLNSIGFTSEDVDLDDFLKLKTAVNTTDLQGLKLNDSAPDASLATPEHERTKLQEQLVGAFKSTREDGAAGPSLLGLQHELLGTNKRLGFGQANDSDTAPMDQQLNAYFQKGLSALAQEQNAGDKDLIMKDIRGHLNDVEWESFISYLDTKSRDAMQYKMPLLEGQDDNGNPLTYMVARDFRKHIGF